MTLTLIPNLGLIPTKIAAAQVKLADTLDPAAEDPAAITALLERVSTAQAQVK